MRKTSIYNSSVNLWITTYCNRQCAYCFGTDWIKHDSENSEYITIEDLKIFIDWLKKSPFANTVRIMGGEPSQHPKLLKIIEVLKNENIEIHSLLTNGLIEKKLFKKITNRIGKYLFNINHPSTYTSRQWSLLEQNMELVSADNSDELMSLNGYHEAKRLTVSITFYQTQQPYDYIIQLAKKYSARSIRFAPAKPAPDLTNNYVDYDLLKDMKHLILNFVKDTVKAGLVPNLDCILPPCIFTVEEWHFLLNFVKNLYTVCNPALEVLPDLKMGLCACNFGVIDFLDIKNDTEPQKTVEHWIKKSNEIRSYPLERCKNCDFFIQKECQGDCLRLKLYKMLN